MYKIVVLTKRKPGMSMAEFRDYYERRHAATGQKLFPFMRRYTRNYLTVIESELAGAGEPPFDCVTEAFFDSETDYRRALEHVAAHPEALAAQAADEANLFDRTKIWWFVAECCDSALESCEPSPASI